MGLKVTITPPKKNTKSKKKMKTKNKKVRTGKGY